ncbi:MAG: hypothetical protein HPY81_03975 [Firmicutes bacterium]|nr:hypothetical protein [Bacillota bacterium]
MGKVSRLKRIQKDRQQKRLRRLGFLLISTLLLASILWLGLSWVKKAVLAYLVKLIVVSDGVIQTTIPGEGLVILDERTVTAPVNGLIRAVVGEGERTRLNAEFARFRPVSGNETSEISLRAPLAGIVCYHPDGLENVLTPQAWDQLDLSKIEQLLDKAGQKSAAGIFSAGQPVAKIINNLNNPLLLVRLSAVDVRLPAVGQTVFLQLDQGKETLTGELTAVRQEQAGVQMLIKLKEFRSELIHQRRVKLSYISERFTGVIVPTTALVERDDESGVYILYKGRVVWKRVEVVGKLGQEAAIRGINPGTEIVKNANLATEGQILQ